MNDIAGKNVLVSGANRGIGAAFVKELLERGAHKIYAGARDPSSFSSLSGPVEVLALNITDPLQVKSAADYCSDVQVLINNAGENTNDHLMAARNSEDARTEMETNYFGTLAMCRAFAPLIEKNGGGAIINMLSITARAPIPLMGSLSASKAASYSLTQSVRAELKPRGIHVMGVLPGAVDTRMSENFPGDKMAPNDVARAVLDGLAKGVADLYPGEMSQGILAGLEADRAGTLNDLAQYV